MLGLESCYNLKNKSSIYDILNKTKTFSLSSYLKLSSIETNYIWGCLPFWCYQYFLPDIASLWEVFLSWEVVFLWNVVFSLLPLASSLENPPRIYKTVVTRPLSHSRLVKFSEWIESERWNEVYSCTDAHKMAETLQNVFVENYWRYFPEKTLKTCNDDEPWFSVEQKKC